MPFYRIRFRVDCPEIEYVATIIVVSVSMEFGSKKKTSRSLPSPPVIVGSKPTDDYIIATAADDLVVALATVIKTPITALTLAPKLPPISLKLVPLKFPGG